MQTATVFNIQKFSLDDGPGIRTVVFLKGCPLRCAWCANPESQRRAPQLEWKESACIGCGSCIEAAPSANTVEYAGKHHIDVRSLRGDAPEAQAAVHNCPTRALTCTGETKTVDEVIKILVDANIPCSPVNSIVELVKDEHIAGARDMFPTLQQNGIGPLRVTNLPVRFSKSGLAPLTSSPEVGEHNEEVFMSIGRSKEEIQRLHENGVI